MSKKGSGKSPRSMAGSFKSFESGVKRLTSWGKGDDDLPKSARSGGSDGSADSRGSRVSRGSRMSKSSAGSKPDDDEEIAGLQIPIFGFGSARYGLLGPAEKDKLPTEGGDIFEIYSDEMRVLLGYKGDYASDLSAGASHVSVLTDYVEEKGGKVLSHGLATFGRLGVGTCRRRLTITDLHKKMSAQSKEKKGIGVKGYDKSEYNPFAPDFSRLPFETATLPGGAVIKDETARYLSKPKRVKSSRPKMVSCGQQHSAVTTEDGKILMWGSARHGRCGLGKNAKTQTSIEDGNDVYCPKPQRAEFPGSRVSYVSCGQKHTIACDDRGDTYVWGLARYGRLGIGDFSELHLESPDENGFFDKFSHHQPEPMIVPGLAGIQIGKVFAGAYNSFAITVGVPSTVYTWGLARYGMLGIGDFPATCCIKDRWDPKVGPQDCDRCKRTEIEKHGVKSYLEEDRGHPHFHRVKITRPRSKEETFMLPEDPEDELDTYVPFPIEMNAFNAVHVSEIYAGTYHHIALTDMGHLFAWGLLRHGRCGIGKYDPNSEFYHNEKKPKFDPHVPKYPKEIKYSVNFKGQYRESAADETAFYQPVPKMIEHLKTVTIIHAAVGDCHSAAVSFENKLYTWGAARHGRLGDVEDWDTLHVDPLDEAGRYRPLPEEVESVEEIKPFKVACTDTSTIVLGTVMPPQWQQFVDKASSRFGWISSSVSRASRSPGSSRPTSAGTSRDQSRAGSRPGSAGSQRSDPSPRNSRSPRSKRGGKCV
jgi:alpha-tubulin suppressor-like RCC1 family protein